MATHSAPLSAEVSWYCEDRGFDLTNVPAPIVRTPEPNHVKGAVFDPARVDKVIAALKCLRHTQGKWAGRPLVPDAWQVAYIIAPVFGWVRKNTDGKFVRIVRYMWVEVPRKNGKTTISAGLALYLAFADSEPAAQVFAGAASKDQAKNAYAPAKIVAEHSPELKAAGVKAQAQHIIKGDGSFFKAVGSVGDFQHGTNPHGTLIDEIHVHKSPDLLDAFTSGQAAREQPLNMVITTADAGGQATAYAREREMIDKLARRAYKDATTYGVVFGADNKAAGFDPFSESAQRAANPGYGISVSPEFLKSAATKAKESPAQLANYLRLHLNIRTKQETKFIELDAWDRNRGLIDESKLRGRRAFGGLDLASTSDLCALCWSFPVDGGGFEALWRHWCPERAYERLNERTSGQAAVWRREGWLTVTPGDVADYDYIRAQINKDREAFDVQAIGYDRWNASQMVNDLVAEDAPMVQIGQGYASMSAPLKAINHLLLEGSVERPKYVHGGNPLMRWQIDNLAVAMDPAGNVKPDKKNAGDKIDGISAAVDAMSVAMSADVDQESIYETRGPLVVSL